MFTSIRKGFFAPFVSARYMFDNPGLLRFAVVPFIINVILYLGFITVAYYAVPALMHKLMGRPELWWQYVLYYIIGAVLVLSVIFILIFMFSIIGNIIASPFNETLARKILIAKNVQITENGYMGVRGALKEAERIIVIELKKALLLVSVSVFSSLINLIPILSIFSLAITAVLIGYNFIDYPLEIMKFTFGNRIRFALKNFWMLLAFGTSSGLILLIPFLNLILLPIAVSGAAMLYQEFAITSTTSRKES